MPSRFPRGSTVYDKSGRAYVVEDVDAGMVYCTADNGVEFDFPESALTPEAEYTLRATSRREVSYQRIRQSRHYLAPKEKLNAADCRALLARLEKLSPGLTDFAAYTAAARALTENKEQDQVPALTVPKCREVWDAAPVEARAVLMAGILATPPHVLVGMGHVGEFLMKAMIDKGLAAQGEAYQVFRNRGRR